jgi:hypothetical protein
MPVIRHIMAGVDIDREAQKLSARTAGNNRFLHLQRTRTQMINDLRSRIAELNIDCEIDERPADPFSGDVEIRFKTSDHNAMLLRLALG